MNDNLKERATTTLKESRRFAKSQKADKEKEDAKSLKGLMNDILETTIDPKGKNEITIDGLTFKAHGHSILQLVTQCSKNHGEIFTEIGGLKDLGYYIENPPKCCEDSQKPEKTPGEQLADIIMDMVRKE